MRANEEDWKTVYLVETGKIMKHDTYSRSTQYVSRSTVCASASGVISPDVNLTVRPAYVA